MSALLQKRNASVFSIPGKDQYTEKDISPRSIHSEYERVVRLLLCEQMMNLPERVNYNCASPERLPNNEASNLVTPLDIVLKNGLEKEGVSYDVQTKVHGNHADFVVRYGNKPVLVQRDGSIHHTS